MKSFLISLFLHATLACSIVFGFGSFLDNDIQGGRAGGSEGNAISENLVTNIQLTYLINNTLNAKAKEIALQELSSPLTYAENKNLEIKEAEHKEKEKSLEKEHISKKEFLLIEKQQEKKDISKKVEKKTQNKTKNIQTKENQQKHTSPKLARNKVRLNENTNTSKALSSATKADTGGIGLGTGQGIGAGDAIKDVPLGTGTGANDYLSKIKSLRKPPYPELSRQAGEEGTAEIIVQVSGGKLIDARMHASSGFSRLDKAALKAVKKAKFAPFSGELIIPIIFTLGK